LILGCYSNFEIFAYTQQHITTQTHEQDWTGSEKTAGDVSEEEPNNLFTFGLNTNIAFCP
jgi:hypothetical protein